MIPDDYIDLDFIEILYDAIKVDDCKLSICSHKVIYDNGTVIDKETNEKNILNSETVLQKILYDNGIDLSAWAKLYDLNLFKNIKYPVGRIYEDAATTYKLIHEAKNISINSKSKYNYIIRSNSISNERFSRRKLDLIISTKEMADFVSSTYPSLKKAANRRLMYAYLSTLSQLANSKEKDKDVEKKLIRYIRKNSISILCDRRCPLRDKFGIITSFAGFKIYQLSWEIYRKTSGRK